MDWFIDCGSFQFPLLMQFSSLHHSLKLSTTYTRVLLSALWANASSGWNTSREIAVWYSVFSELPVELLSLLHNCSRASLLPLCLPACLSEWPCRICMVIEVITASSVYLWLLSPRRFIPGVEASGWKTARSHFEDELQQLTTPLHCSFPPFFSFCTLSLYSPHFYFDLFRIGGPNTHFFTRS